MDEYIGSAIASGNTRISKVRQFLAKPPKRMAFLRLVAAGSEDTAQVPLGEWQQSEVLPELAAEIVALLDQHAEEMEAHITANLSYVDEAGKLVRTLVLKRQGNHVMGDGTGLLGPEEINASLTGDMRSQAQGAQRHLEVMCKVYMTGMAGLLAHSERIVTRQSEMLETLASRLGRADRRADSKEEELDELVQALRDARDADQGGGTSPAMERAFVLLERIAPHLLAQFAANQQTKPAQAGGE